MPTFDWEDDGLDADGYPIPRDTRLRYRHGSEEEAGDWQPKTLYEVATKIVRKVHLFSVDLSRDRGDKGGQ
jgi:hypothetical protein